MKTRVFSATIPVTSVAGRCGSGVKALESSERADWTQWCSYWVIFYNLRVIESFGISTILFWCPFYYAFKLALLVWCFLPTTHGAAFLYSQFWREPAARSTARS